MKKKDFKAVEPGKCIVIVEDPFGGACGMLQSVGNIDIDEALQYAAEFNGMRKRPSDCIFWVYDDQGKCLNPKNINIHK